MIFTEANQSTNYPVGINVISSLQMSYCKLLANFKRKDPPKATMLQKLSMCSINLVCSYETMLITTTPKCSDVCIYSNEGYSNAFNCD